MTSSILSTLIKPIIIVADWGLPNLCSIAEADDSDSNSTSVDLYHIRDYIFDEFEHVVLEIIVVHVTCRVYQEQYVSLLSAIF